MQHLNWLSKLPKKKVYYAVTAVVVVICIIGGFLWKEYSQTKPVAEDIPLVRVTTVNLASAAQSYTYSGEVRGRYESQLAFQINTTLPFYGKIIKRNVEVGSIVKPGDVLMQLDASNLQETANSNSAQIHSAEAQRKLAENNLRRYRQLFAQGAVSQADLDQYESAYGTAVASVEQVSAQYAQSINQVDYCFLYADKPGVVSSISAEVGQVVNSGQTVLTVVQDGEREIEISVPENRIETLRQTSQIKVTFWALPAVVVGGTVREISPMADATTRTYKVRIQLVNAPPEIKLGMTAAVTLTGSEDRNAPSAVVIPLAAIYQTNDSPGVWVVTDDIVNLRPVQIGSFGDGQVQVLAGLNPGETIVTAGVHKLREGQKVWVATAGGDSQ
jgi:RND family efflux transporter MFP subunit